jgi:hypothetical protein
MSKLFLKRGQRNESEFFGEQLLFDHLTEDLDPSRTAYLLEQLEKYPRLKKRKKSLEAGMKYLSDIQEFQPSQSAIAQVKSPSSYMGILLEKIKIDEWPIGVRLGIEGFVILAGILALAMVVPWNSFLEYRLGSSEQVILSEVDRSKVGFGAEPETIAKIEQNPGNLFPDESSKRPPSEPGIKETQPPSPPQVAAADEPNQKPNDEAKKMEGFLYRGTIEVTNVQAVAPKFVEKISEMGGRKAGEVPLGWRKGSGSYFHFTMPEKGYQDLSQFMNEYGALRIAKEKHERVMPDGIIRLIIQVNEKVEQ